MKKQIVICSIFAAGLSCVSAFMTCASAQATQPGVFNTVPVMSSQAGSFRQGSGLIKVGKNGDLNEENRPQSETSVSVDPTDSNHLLFSVNDLSVSSGAGAVVWESTDGGKTFSSFNQNSSSFCYDTWLAFNTAGDAFMSYQCSNRNIAYKKKGQNSWTSTTLTNAGGFPDRDMVTVDNSTTSKFKGSVYIGYDDNGSNNAPYVLYSRNGFHNWQRSPQISTQGTPTIGVNVARGRPARCMPPGKTSLAKSSGLPNRPMGAQPGKPLTWLRTSASTPPHSLFPFRPKPAEACCPCPLPQQPPPAVPMPDVSM